MHLNLGPDTARDHQMIYTGNDQSVLSAKSVSDILTEKILHDAEQNKRFAFQISELHSIQVYNTGAKTHYGEFPIDQTGACETTLRAALASVHQPNEISNSNSCTLSRGTMRCFFQRGKPEHLSTRPDKLSFEDRNTCQNILQALDLPTSYLQIADGIPAVAFSQQFRDQDRAPVRYELVSHCTTKQGNWALSLSHDAKSRTTSVFWSVDDRIDSSSLAEELRGFRAHAHHPMLIPCIMFASIFRSGVDRRNSIKERLQQLENCMLKINRLTAQRHKDNKGISTYLEEEHEDVERLFELLNSCRTDQKSQEGRYHFWTSFHNSMLDGFYYFEEAMKHELDAECIRTHSDLKQWAAITWERLESLKARDKDHISRVDNSSDMLYNLIHQRDRRIQADIAKATQRDSEDMKFIALLGSVFLPAGLVASILNVQEFQFLPGAKLFGVYIAMILPLICVVVALCISRPFRSGLRGKRYPSIEIS